MEDEKVRGGNDYTHVKLYTHTYKRLLNYLIIFLVYNCLNFYYYFSFFRAIINVYYIMVGTISFFAMLYFFGPRSYLPSLGLSPCVPDFCNLKRQNYLENRLLATLIKKIDDSIDSNLFIICSDGER